MRPTRALATVSLVGALALTGCSQAEDAAKDAGNDAACSVARSAVDEAGRRAGNAVDEIGADPKAAEGDLRGIRDALATAEKGVSGDTKQKLGDARSAVERLLGEAEDAAQGAEVDTAVVDDAKGDLDRAVKDVKNLC
jgi:hypothetical protein